MRHSERKRGISSTDFFGVLFVGNSRKLLEFLGFPKKRDASASLGMTRQPQRCREVLVLLSLCVWFASFALFVFMLCASFRFECVIPSASEESQYEFFSGALSHWKLKELLEFLKFPKRCVSRPFHHIAFLKILPFQVNSSETFFQPTKNTSPQMSSLLVPTISL